MFGLVLYASLVLGSQDGDQPPPEPGVEAFANAVRQFAYFSKSEKAEGEKPSWIITDIVLNDRTEDVLAFVLQSGVRGVIAKAARENGKVVPRSLTMVRTTYRTVREVSNQLTGTGSRGDSITLATQCRGEAGTAVSAFPGGLLEAKLLDGGADGTVLVRCVCRVSGSKEAGYTYAYVVDNQSDKAVKFQWAGLEGEVKPGQDFVKLVESKELTAEESGLATLDFGSGRSFTIRTNFWARPK